MYFIEWSHRLESLIGVMEWSIGVDSWTWSEMLERKRNIYSCGKIGLF